MDRMRSTSPLVPSSLSPEVSEQQIYENSEEAILSASPMFNGATKTTSSNQMLPGISVSPPPASDFTSQANNQKIYENSQEFFMMEDNDEDDGYENDLPGLHRWKVLAFLIYLWFLFLFCGYVVLYCAIDIIVCDFRLHGEYFARQ